MALARCWVRVCLRRGIVSPRLVVSLPWASPGMSRVMTAAVGSAQAREQQPTARMGGVGLSLR